MSRDSQRLRTLSKRLGESGPHYGWEERHGDAIEIVHSAQLLEQVAVRLERYEQVTPLEERVAWDRVVAGYDVVSHQLEWDKQSGPGGFSIEYHASMAAAWADAVLEQRRDRFGSSEPEPKK